MSFAENRRDIEEALLCTKSFSELANMVAFIEANKEGVVTGANLTLRKGDLMKRFGAVELARQVMHEMEQLDMCDATQSVYYAVPSKSVYVSLVDYRRQRAGELIRQLDYETTNYNMIACMSNFQDQFGDRLVKSFFESRNRSILEYELTGRDGMIIVTQNQGEIEVKVETSRSSEAFQKRLEPTLSAIQFNLSLYWAECRKREAGPVAQPEAPSISK